MTGLPYFNYPAFWEAEKFLISKGFSVKSPHHTPRQDSWSAYMRLDITMLCECDSIYMLPGWENSKGAKLEKMIADSLGMEIFYFGDL
jgi:hypothetical protein